MLDQAHEALTDLRLLLDEGHREARCLAQLDARQRIARRPRIVHAHLG